MSSEPAPAGIALDVTPGPGRSSRSRWALVFLASAVVAGLVPRLLLILGGKLNSDEAIVGLMGMEILNGRHFAFYMGQGYMGSLEAYTAALLFALFGPGAPVLKLAPFGYFLAAAWFHHRLAARLFGDLAGRLALVFIFCSSWCFSVFSFAPRGGYMTDIAIGGAALLLGARMTADGGRARDNVLLGLLCGLGLWTHFLFVYYLVPLGLLVVVPALRLPGRLRRLAALGGGFLAGALPLILWNLRHEMGSFRLKKIAGHPDFWRNVHNLFERQLSYLLTGEPLREQNIFWAPLFWLVLVVWIAAIAWFLWRAFGRCAQKSADCRATLLIPGVALVNLALFLGTGYGGMNTQRYLLPLYPLAAIALAVLTADLWRFRTALGAALALLVVGVNLWGAGWVVLTKGLPEGRVQRQQVAEVLEYCRKEKVTRAWAGHWTCYLLTYLSRQELVVADADRDRYEPFQNLVASSSDASLIAEGRPWQVSAALASAGLSWKEGGSAYWTVYVKPRPDPALGPPGRRLRTRVTDTEGGAFGPLPGGGVRTVAPQAAGDRVTLGLGAVRLVNGILLSPGGKTREHPAQFVVETSVDGAAWSPASKVDYPMDGISWDGRIRWDRSGILMARFTPRPAAFVRVTLGQSEKERRWSLDHADVLVAEDDSGPGSTAASTARGRMSSSPGSTGAGRTLRSTSAPASGPG